MCALPIDSVALRAGDKISLSLIHVFRDPLFYLFPVDGDELLVTDDATGKQVPHIQSYIQACQDLLQLFFEGLRFKLDDSDTT